MAINLALKADGLTSPNPIVGALIVKGGKIIGRGYHKKAGLAHAEINALDDARWMTKSATLYVSLEPCDHFGRTPPCTDAIIKSGIKKVVIGMKDPNPINNSRGIRKLKSHGITVHAGVLEKEARAINKPYIKFITKRIPYVTVKVGQSLDGKIATRAGDSKWITSDESRRYVHELRGKMDAVIVGVNTVLKDDPLLTNRLYGAIRKQPVRIVVDERLNTPLDAKIFLNLDRSPVLMATTKKSPKAKRYERIGAEVLVVKSKGGLVDLKDLLRVLARRGLIHVMVEGGGELIASFVEERLVDRFLFFLAPKIIGGRLAKTSVEGEGIEKVKDAIRLRNIKIRRFNEDVLIEAEAD